MNVGPGSPSGGGGQRRRRRGRRPSNRAGQPGGRDRQQLSGIYTAPMDHNYRGAAGGDKGRGRGGRAGFVPYPPLLMPLSNPTRSRPTRTPTPASSPSWMIYFSKPRFRKPRASSM